MDFSTPGLPVHHQLPELAQTHLHRVGDAIQPSHPLLPLLLLPSIYPSIRIFSNEPVLHIRWPKYWSFSFSISPSNEHQDRSPLGWTDWISLQSKGLSRVFSNTTVQKHQFLGVQLSLWPIKTWSSGLSNLKGEVGEYLNWIVSCAEVPITYGPHLRLASEVRAILWDWAHNQENPGWLWVVSIRTESNCGIPSCCQRIRGMVGVGKDTTYLMSKEKTA